MLSENSQFSSSVEAVPRAPKPNSKQYEQRKRGARLSCPSATGTDHLSTSRFEFLSESPAQVLKSCFRRSRRTSRGIAKQQALMLQQEGWTPLKRWGWDSSLQWKSASWDYMPPRSPGWGPNKLWRLLVRPDTEDKDFSDSSSPWAFWVNMLLKTG